VTVTGPSLVVLAGQGAMLIRTAENVWEVSCASKASLGVTKAADSELAALATGIVKVTTSTGTLSIATADDLPVGPTAATYSPATGAQTVALNCTGKDEHFVNGHASGTAITFTITGATNNQCFFVRLLQGAVASTVSAWFTGVTWRNTAGGAAPALPAANKVGFYWFVRTGTNTYSGLLIAVEP
jgi:hypothetical protein